MQMIIPNGRGVKMHSEPARVILENARIQDITTAEDWSSRAAPAGFWSWRGQSRPTTGFPLSRE